MCSVPLTLDTVDVEHGECQILLLSSTRHHPRVCGIVPLRQSQLSITQDGIQPVRTINMQHGYHLVATNMSIRRGCTRTALIIGLTLGTY